MIAQEFQIEPTGAHANLAQGFSQLRRFLLRVGNTCEQRLDLCDRCIRQIVPVREALCEPCKGLPGIVIMRAASDEAAHELADRIEALRSRIGPDMAPSRSRIKSRSTTGLEKRFACMKRE